MPLRCRMRCSSEEGQATVEAAALLPTLMLLLALLLQPLCLLYTRAAMRGVAAEMVRVLATGASVPEADVRAYALRRLAAVPEVPLFHVGGRSDWELAFERSDTSATVTIAGHLRPLPLLGLSAEALGTRDEVGIRVEVRVEERTRATWVEGSYGSWISVWK